MTFSIRSSLLPALTLVLCTPTLGVTADMPMSSAVAAIMPIPGYYSVDIDSHVVNGDAARRGNSAHFRGDAQTGNGDVRYQAPDGRSRTVQAPGTGPVMTCVRPSRSMPMPFANGCTGAPATIVNGEVHMEAQCSGQQVSIAIRKTGAATWEYRTKIVQSGTPLLAPGSATGLATLPRPVLEGMARNGATAQMRADATRALVAQSAKPQVTRVAKSGGSSDEFSTVQKLTRVGDTCPAGR